MKKVSVVVPVYNTSLYLKECIDSLVNQTLDDIEIILINDGSTDNSLSIINEYKKKYPQKIIIISQENLGISVARNAGIKVSKGKYIGFVDSDDFVKLDMFEKLYEKIENANCDIVVCDYQKYTMIDNNYEYIDVTKNIKKDNIYEDPSLIFNIDFGPCNKLYKKELFNDIKFPINKKYEDLNAILKVFLEAQKISVIKSPLYIYRQNEKGETLTVDYKISDILYILEDLLVYAKSNKNYNVLEKYFKKMCVNKLIYYLVYSYKLNDKEFILTFRKNIINFLNKNFKYWKLELLNDKRLNMKLISKIVVSSNFLFKLYSDRKFAVKL